MIISEPNDFVAEVHDRMPVVLMPEQFEHWLSGEMGVEELKPAPNDYLQRWAVSKRVNSSRAGKETQLWPQRSRWHRDLDSLSAGAHDTLTEFTVCSKSSLAISTANLSNVSQMRNGISFSES